MVFTKRQIDDSLTRLFREYLVAEGLTTLGFVARIRQALPGQPVPVATVSNLRAGSRCWTLDSLALVAAGMLLSPADLLDSAELDYEEGAATRQAYQRPPKDTP